MSATASQAKPAPPASHRPARVDVWDLPLRLFHWLLVLAIAVAFLSSEEDSPLNQWHVLAGWVAGILVVFRLVWGFVGGEHSRFVDFVRPSRIKEHIADLIRRRGEPTLGHNPVGGISVVVLLALTTVVVWSGAFGGETAEDLHELAAWTLLAFIGLHVAAVLVMSFLERENLIGAMITGKKAAARHPGAADAKRPGVIAILVAIAVLAGAVYAVLQYDPQAFKLRPAEAFEQRAGGAVDGIPAQQEKDEDRD